MSPPTSATPTIDSKQPERAPDQALEQIALAQRRDQGETEDREPEVLDGSEGECHLRERRRQQEQKGGADEAAADGSETGERDGEIAVAALRHRIAVERRRDGRGRAGVLSRIAE